MVTSAIQCIEEISVEIRLGRNRLPPKNDGDGTLTTDGLCSSYLILCNPVESRRHAKLHKTAAAAFFSKNLVGWLESLLTNPCIGKRERR